jgi:hypothetical protein
MIPAENNIPDQKLLKALDSLKISLFTMNNTSKICSHIVNFIKENFEAESVKIFVLNEESAGFFPYDQPTDESSKFTLFNFFILWMADHDGIYSIKDLLNEDKNDIKEIVLDISNVHNFSFVIPLIMNRSLIGFIFIFYLYETRKPIRDKYIREGFERM